MEDFSGFDSKSYGHDVSRILSLDGNGERLMPLTCAGCSSAKAQQMMKTQTAEGLFPRSREPKAAMAGLWLYFSCFEEAHEIVAESNLPDCELWHAILHRQEPDAGNAAYWFRKVGTHAVYSALAHGAVKILEKLPDAEFRTGRWDPFAFVAFCERARAQPGSVQECAALEIQRAEWQILFDYCARPR
jgi:hypothetical protein